MKAAEAVVRILESEGITDAFGIPGAGINPVYKFLGESDKIKHYTVRHEEAAVHAADAYYRASGRMALAICTSGPGATNFVTGIYTANIDSIPLIAITGQGASNLLGKDAFQCVDIADICRPIAKATWCVTNPADIPTVMRQAFQTARAGKPGPVMVDLPLDVQMADIDYDPQQDGPLTIFRPGPDLALVEQAISLIRQAKNPIMIIGGGVLLSGAEQLCVQLAEMMHLPIITTYMAKGAVAYSHPLHLGHMGIQCGSPVGNKYFVESDVVLGIGCRFTDRHTGDVKVYAGNRKFIHIDIEPKQIGKILNTEVGIVADAKMAAQAFIDGIQSSNLTFTAAGRVARIPDDKQAMQRKTDYDNVPIKPQRVFDEINRNFDENTIFTTGCGLNQIWSGQFQQIEKPRKYLPSGGAGTLGFDIPAAFGAMIGSPGNKAVAVMGDFGFTFLVEELAVASTYQVPLIVLIINNAYLGLIRQGQKYGLDFEYAVSMKENQTTIDYIKVAEGFGCAGERVFDPKGIAPAIERAKAAKVPYVIDIICEEQTDCSMGPSVSNVREFV